MKGFTTVLLTLFLVGTSAFVPVQQSRLAAMPFVSTRRTSAFGPSLDRPAALVNQRKSVAQVQTMGLFGLGAPEIAIILVAAAFLLGPQKLAELGKDAGKIAGELKEVPKEFQKGLEEGEAQAQAMKKELVGEEEPTAAQDAETESE